MSWHFENAIFRDEKPGAEWIQIIRLACRFFTFERKRFIMLHWGTEQRSTYFRVHVDVTWRRRRAIA